jgi:hypothetical protein
MRRRWGGLVDGHLETRDERVEHGSRRFVAEERRVKEVSALHDDVWVLLLDEVVEPVRRAEVLRSMSV